jgi:hypothetical protein
MKPYNDLTGRQFGFLVVAAHARTYKHRRYWKVRCTLCGGDKVIAAQNLLCGRSKELRMRCPGKSARENDAPDDCRKVRSIQSSRDDGSGGTSSDEACILPNGMQ